MAWAKDFRSVAPLVVAFGAAGYMFYWGLSSAASEGVSIQKPSVVAAQGSGGVKQKAEVSEMQRGGK